MVSFSTCFTFSMSPENGDGLAFVVVPVRFPLNLFDGGSFGLLTANKFRTLVVEFDTSMDDKYGDLNGNHVGVDLNNFVSVKVSNVSSINLVINSGNKLHSCIDYEAGLRRLEVRLSKLGDTRPVSPLLSCPIDLSHVWKEEEILIGLSSSNGNSSQSCNLYSWSFQQRILPQWMHSEPLDPNAILEKKKGLEVPKKSDCLLKVLAALVFGTACGALGGVIVLFVWIILGNNRPVAPEEYPPKLWNLSMKSSKLSRISRVRAPSSRCLTWVFVPVNSFSSFNLYDPGFCCCNLMITCREFSSVVCHLSMLRSLEYSSKLSKWNIQWPDSDDLGILVDNVLVFKTNP
ncbi:Non-specific serine/threonine protein kinase [Bertholletia excelsa]